MKMRKMSAKITRMMTTMKTTTAAFSFCYLKTHHPEMRGLSLLRICWFLFWMACGMGKG